MLSSLALSLLVFFMLASLSTPFRLAVPLARRATPFAHRSFSSLFSLATDATSSDPSPLTLGSTVATEVTSFGPLGASVTLSHPSSPDPIGTGLVLQLEIELFRRSRKSKADVVVGEVLTGYVQKVHPAEYPDDLPKLDISLRPLGTNAVVAAASRITTALSDPYNNGILGVGDKSAPAAVEKLFPGVTKTIFKKAVGKLYKDGVIERPGKEEIRLVEGKEEREKEV